MPVYICNIEKPVEHCRQVCLHGRQPHPADDCTKTEYCLIVGQVVNCRKVGQRELRQYFNQERI